MIALTALCTLLGLGLNPQVPDPQNSAAEWQVQEFRGPSYPVEVDSREGTWMSVDVHPGGQELVFDFLGDLYRLPIEGGKAVSLISGPAWQYQPRYSPDGQSIVFCSDQGGGDNLWIMDRDGQNPRALTTESFRLINSPAWTPDGLAVAGRKHFTHRRSAGAGEIWLFHLAGGQGIPMTRRQNDQKDVGEPAFSPDGRFLYYSQDVTPGTTFEYNKDPNKGIYAIKRLDRHSGESLTLLSGPGGAVRPTPSPDGRWLAFVRRVRYQTTLFVYDLEKGEARELDRELERDMQETWAIHGVYPQMSWTPDSREIVYWAQGKLFRWNLEKGEKKQIPFHVQDQRLVQEAVRFPVDVAPDRFSVKALRWVRVAPHGDWVIYQALGYLWRKDLNSGKVQRLTDQEDHFEFYPAISPDGKAVVYTTWNDEKLGSVRYLDLESGQGRLLSSEPGHYADPVFHPGGEQILYRKSGGGYLISPLHDRDPGWYRVSLLGGPAQRIRKSGSQAHFGPEKDRVYFVDQGRDGKKDRRALVSVDLFGREERTHLVSEAAQEIRISPDGTAVGVVERYRAYVMPILASGSSLQFSPKGKNLPIQRISNNAGENLQWSPDGRRLHWSLGNQLYTWERSLRFWETESEPVESGQNIGFEAETDRPTGKIALLGARLITMRGEEVIEPGAVVIEGNRIAAVGPIDQIEIPEDAWAVSLPGTTIVPGFLDVHAHGGQAVQGLTPQQNWQHHANLAFGVTTIHDPSHDTNSIFAVSEMAKAGVILSPRTFSTGTILYGAYGTFQAQVDSLEDARAHLQRLQAVGAFSVKSYNQPRRDQRQMILQAARELGMMVVPEGGSDHTHNLTMVVDGHTGVEHSLPLERIYQDVQQLWGKTQVGYTPTLIVGYGGIWGENYWYDQLNVWENQRLNRFVPAFVLDPRSRRRIKSPEAEYNTLKSAGICKALVDAGAKVQLGAHGQLAGFGAQWELWMLAQGGLSPMQALRAATLDGAFYLGMDQDLGSLESGKLADLLVLDGNPLEDIRQSQNIRYTMLNGRLYDATTMAEVEAGSGRLGQAPRYFWTDRDFTLSAQLEIGACLCTQQP
ncbi:MAG: amidohydrolase [Planctomycetota bacterium]|nr:MAG: amidohydrolase [Planctomycetota bacterium]